MKEEGKRDVVRYQRQTSSSSHFVLLLEDSLFVVQLVTIVVIDSNSPGLYGIVVSVSNARSGVSDCPNFSGAASDLEFRR